MLSDTQSGAETNQDLALAALEDLLQRSEQCLVRLPGFRSLSLFGSLAENRADAYSDIDLVITTDNLPEAQAQLPALLEEIGPVEFCWAIPLRPGEWNPTVVFSEESYYHRLDIALAPYAGSEAGILAERKLEPAGEAGHSRQERMRSDRAYAPSAGTVGHFLLGQFLGGMRYVKAHKRGQTATCYRFAVAAMDWRMRTYYACLTGNHSLQTKLSTQEYAALDGLLAPEQQSDLLALLDLSTPEAMDHAVCAIFERLRIDCLDIAAKRGEVLPEGVFLRMLRFIKSELGIID